MKKYFLTIAATLLFACSAFAAVPESIVVALDRYDQCQALAQHCDAVVSAKMAGPAMELPGLERYQSPLLRPDMRVASAGFLFSRCNAYATSRSPSYASATPSSAKPAT